MEDMHKFTEIEKSKEKEFCPQYVIITRLTSYSPFLDMLLVYRLSFQINVWGQNILGILSGTNCGTPHLIYMSTFQIIHRPSRWVLTQEGALTLLSITYNW